MSQQTIESILTRAMSDASFAETLFAEPDSALAGFDLTAEEIAKFKGLTRTQFQSMSIEDRKSFGIIVHERTGGGENHNETML